MECELTSLHQRRATYVKSFIVSSPILLVLCLLFLVLIYIRHVAVSQDERFCLFMCQFCYASMYHSLFKRVRGRYYLYS